jgi:hypothetical protein
MDDETIRYLASYLADNDYFVKTKMSEYNGINVEVLKETIETFFKDLP